MSELSFYHKERASLVQMAVGWHRLLSIFFDFSAPLQNRVTQKRKQSPSTDVARARFPLRCCVWFEFDCFLVASRGFFPCTVGPVSRKTRNFTGDINPSVSLIKTRFKL